MRYAEGMNRREEFPRIPERDTGRQRRDVDNQQRCAGRRSGTVARSHLGFNERTRLGVR